MNGLHSAVWQLLPYSSPHCQRMLFLTLRGATVGSHLHGQAIRGQDWLQGGKFLLDCFQDCVQHILDIGRYHHCNSTGTKTLPYLLAAFASLFCRAILYATCQCTPAKSKLSISGHQTRDVDMRGIAALQVREGSDAALMLVDF